MLVLSGFKDTVKTSFGISGWEFFRKYAFKIAARPLVISRSARIRVFPLLMNLAQKHLRKLDKGWSISYNKQLTDLTAKLGAARPLVISRSARIRKTVPFSREAG